MCTVKPEKIEILLLSALRIQSGMPALQAYQLLQDKGACLAHFCDAVHALNRAGSIKSSDAANPIVAGLPPAKILELALVPELDGAIRPAKGKEIRVLSQGFKVFLDQPLGRGSFGIVYKGEQVRMKRPVAIKILRLSSLPKDVPRDWFMERFRRPFFGKLEIDVTVDDPKSYMKPFTVRINQRFMADEEPMEFICNENQQFRRRIKVD